MTTNQIRWQLTSDWLLEARQRIFTGATRGPPGRSRFQECCGLISGYPAKEAAFVDKNRPDKKGETK